MIRKISVLSSFIVLIGYNLNAQVSTNDGKPIAASLFFGAKGSHYSDLSSDKIQITQMRNEYNYGVDPDSPIYIPDGSEASVNPKDNESSVSYHAGLNLGAFPKFSTFRIDESQVLAIGAVFGASGNFGDGAGFNMGFAPEINYQKNKFGIHLGLEFSYSGVFKELGDFQLEGTDRIIVRSESLDGCEEDDFKGGNARCRMHDNNSTVQMSSFAGSTTPYLRLAYMYNEEKNSGVGLLIGHRFANNRPVDYVLKGGYDYETGGATETKLNGPEFDNLSNAFDFSGVFIQIELVFRPFRK